MLLSTFSPLSVDQPVCITQSYEPRTSGAPRVGSALAVGRMVIPNDPVEGGTKGKVLTLLHAWKTNCGRWVEKKDPPDPDSFEAT